MVFTLHHVPRNSGRTGGGVGVLINDRVKLVTRLEPINKAVSFESMEMIITIVSISIRTSCYLPECHHQKRTN